MDVIKSLELVSALLAIFGCFVIMFPKIWAFYALILSNVLALVVYFDRSQFFFLSQAIVLITFNSISIYRWKKQKIG